jgi:hypothetical protein
LEKTDAHIQLARVSFTPKADKAPFIFESISSFQDFATRWLWTYNNERSNMALGGITSQQKLELAA